MVSNHKYELKNLWFWPEAFEVGPRLLYNLSDIAIYAGKQ
jgi:hypothetical protein